MSGTISFYVILAKTKLFNLSYITKKANIKVFYIAFYSSANYNKNIIRLQKMKRQRILHDFYHTQQLNVKCHLIFRDVKDAVPYIFLVDTFTVGVGFSAKTATLLSLRDISPDRGISQTTRHTEFFCVSYHFHYNIPLSFCGNIKNP